MGYICLFTLGSCSTASLYIYLSYIQWDFQDPKMEVLYHIRQYFAGIFPYIGLIYGIGTSNLGSCCSKPLIFVIPWPCSKRSRSSKARYQDVPRHMLADVPILNNGTTPAWAMAALESLESLKNNGPGWHIGESHIQEWQTTHVYVYAHIYIYI